MPTLCHLQANIGATSTLAEPRAEVGLTGILDRQLDSNTPKISRRRAHIIAFGPRKAENIMLRSNAEMVRHCAVEDCGNFLIRCGKPIHQFLKDEQLRALWIRLARPSFPAWLPTSSDCVCSYHFRDEDYERSPRVMESVGFPAASTCGLTHCLDADEWCPHSDSSDSEDLGASGKQPLEGDDPTYCPPEDSSVRPERETPSLVGERKFIVFESCLDLLLGKCQVCSAPLIHVDKSVVGCSLQVYSICRSGHVNDRCSQPIIKRKPVGSILMAAEILFSGSCITKTLRTLTSMGVVCFSYGIFYNIQKAFLLPSIEKVWNKHQNELFAAAAGRHLTIAADGRADSPGHSAKYGTYTMLDADDNKVIHVETVQSNESGGCYHMELEGLKRSLSIFEAHSLIVAILVTDRYPQLNAWLGRERPDICHLFDCWHVGKGIKKKLVAAAKSRHLEELGSWTRAVVNHLYWCAGTSVDNLDLILPKWKSLVAHVVGLHTHADPLFPDWSPAHQKLVEIVLSTHLLRDIPRLSTSTQTFATECFHSTLLQFAPKQVHFSFRRMKASFLCTHQVNWWYAV
ncbi:hypothetical protein HPB47_015927 [Ixodes persulcatus]|uniref:Uncharacterized protein n=1 Tax=Ixodes persulcatus TaxID=34615 RepID=A0AC60QS75_IXOPE|nr:hypothetical protein HPB47_015927 [Ixodes persulcatus]